MPITPLSGIALANDKFRASLRSTWVASPADTTLQVDAIPDNVPTIIVVGWNTDLETVFSVEGTSGSSSADYALTGVVRLKGANVNLPENTPVNCLNNEEFFNQYEEKINEVIDEVNDALDSFPASGTVGLTETQTLTNKRINSRVVITTDDSTSVINVDITDEYVLTAVANATTFTVTGTPTDGQKLIVRFKDAGVAKALTWTGFTSRGSTLPTTTVAGKWHRVGLMYNLTATTFDCVAAIVEA